MSNGFALPKKLEDELDSIKHYKSAPTSSKNVRAIMDDSAERAMYDEILGPLLNRSSSKPTVRLDNTQRIIPSTPTSTSDFTTTLLSRLKIVETEAKDARRQLSEQVIYNGKLEREIVDLKCIAIAPQDVLDDLAETRRENSSLRQKIREMEKFLSDYGLEWVGHNNLHSSDEVEDDDGDEEGEDELHQVSFADFNTRIQELNEVVYSEPAKVTMTDSRKARLVQASELVENIKVVFYQNGLFIQRGPFRSCSSDNYRSFVSDVMDGYFPSEFRATYPDGVTFDLKDRHDTRYVDGDTHDTHQRMTSGQFLNRLPKTVVRNGEIVDIRGDIDKRIHGVLTTTSSTAQAKNNAAAADAAETRAQAKSGLDIRDGSKYSLGDNSGSGTPTGVVSVSSSGKAGIVTLSTPAAVEALRRQQLNADCKADDGGTVMERIVQVQVKHTEGRNVQVLLAQMFEHDTIRDLRTQITKWLTEQQIAPQIAVSSTTTSNTNGNYRQDKESNSDSLDGIAQIELRNAYPPRILTDVFTLREAGLVPNGTVHSKRL